MIFKLNNKKIRLVADPHIGRKFEAGVPLHRRGEREAGQIVKLRKALGTPHIDININVGDTFEHPFVTLSAIVSVYDAYCEAATALPDTQFYILAGNHDLPRKIGTTGALDILELLLGGCKNIKVVREVCVLDDILFLPWEWGRTEWSIPNEPYEAVVGHCDLKSYGGDDSHLFPVGILADVPLYSGHYHTPGVYEIDGREIYCTGSLEPYSHAEDPDGELYVTLTLNELAQRDDLEHKMVRVLLKEGEELPTGHPYLALTGKRIASEQPEVILSLDGFDWQKVLEEKLEPLTPNVREFITDRMKHHSLDLE